MYLILNLIVIIIIGVLGGEKRNLYYAAIALYIIAFLCLIGATITKYLSQGSPSENNCWDDLQFRRLNSNFIEIGLKSIQSSTKEIRRRFKENVEPFKDRKKRHF